MEDIIGKKFGKLTVVKKSERKAKNGDSYYDCVCECGNFKSIIRNNILRGATISCGCHSGKIPNEIEEREDCICIKIKGKEVLIDKDDYDKIKKYKFNISVYGYVTNWKIGRLHRYIMGKIPENIVVDHINGNKLDNRKTNLRFATITQNMWNSKCKGYCYDKRAKKWKVYLTYEGKVLHFGYFKTEQEAINKRKEVEREFFGEFIRKDKFGVTSE